MGHNPATVAAELPYLVAQGRTHPVYNDLELQVYIDVAWQPRQLESLLMALRPYCRRRMIVVLGTAGNRSRTTRVALGKICGELADLTILQQRAPGRISCCHHIGLGERAAYTTCEYEIFTERAEGIARAITIAAPGDMILLIGKGEQNFEVSSQETKTISDLIVARQVIDNLESQRRDQAATDGQLDGQQVKRQKQTLTAVKDGEGGI